MLAHKIELRLTAQQAEYLDCACDSRRHAFNQLLAHFSEEGVKWSKKAANEKYRELRIEFPWYVEVCQRVTRNAVDDLHNAFTHFFRRLKKGKKPGYPRFKKRGLHDSFALREKPGFDVEGRTLRIEKLKTRIKMREALRFTGTPCQVTVAKLHYRIGNQRLAILHEVSDYLTANFSVITIEDLNVRGMTKNHKLACAVNDAGFGMLRQFIDYKAELRQREVVIADRFFPSSKTCSDCGYKNDGVVLGVEWWDYPKCKAHHNRYFNGSVNLNRYGRDTLQLDLKPYTRVA